MSANSFKIFQLKFIAIVLFLSLVTIGVLFLLENISERKREAQQVAFRVVNIDETTQDPAIWGKNFPYQYDQYLRTVDTVRTKYGGSEAFQKLDADPVWRELFAGFAFGIDYREERGHAYMLSDQRETERVLKRKQPGACLHCHASMIIPYYEAGLKAGGSSKPEDRVETIRKGFEVLNPMPYQEATQHAKYPITCIDCHDPQNMKLRTFRPAFLEGIAHFAASNDPAPQYPSIENWRKGKRDKPYDPNELATRQEMRTFVCAQCHVEYYFKGDEKRLVYPWHNGLKMEQLEKYYDDVKFKDWEHAISGASTLKAQHPEFELFSQGIHSRAGVACADCHMPYLRVGAVKISDHHVRSPLLNINRACQTCHNVPERELLERAETIQTRTQKLLDEAEIAVQNLVHAIQKAKEKGASDKDLELPRQFHRKSQWRLDYVSAENSSGFHADQEAARILAEAIDFARQGEIALYKTISMK
ncbi:MAG: ammonia-forming cytochrome c nitrite reductase subunit c552 [bacterium]|nr:ammonia-forming cytochrome c nitrite reductase subunit c552 [bacterium]